MMALIFNFILACALVPSAAAFSPSSTGRTHCLLVHASDTSESFAGEEKMSHSRRNFVEGTMASFMTLGVVLPPTSAEAKPDCMTDCVKNCKVRKHPKKMHGK